MNTQIHRNKTNTAQEQPRGGYSTRSWAHQGAGHSGTMSSTLEARNASMMERARARAATLSALVIVFMLTAAIAITAIAISTSGRNKTPIDNGPEVSAPVAFAVPLEGDFTVLRYYSDDELFWNATTLRWEGYKSYQLAASTGTSVLATYAGTVSNISTSSTHGLTVTIEHRDGLKTVYCGLDSDLAVKRGDYVEKGQQIGVVGEGMPLVEKDGPLLHIEVYKDDVKVNPADYIAFGDK